MNRLLLPALGVSVVSNFSGSAIGEERIESNIPTLAAYEAVLPIGDRWRRGEEESRVSAAWSLGVGFGEAEGHRGALGAVSGALGYRSGAYLLGAASELTGFAPADDDTLELAALRGRHRGIALAHFGDRRDDRAVALSLEGWARHSGDQAFRLDSPRFGSVGMRTGGLDAAAILRLGDSEFAPGVPVHYGAEETRWQDGPLASATTQSAAMALAFVPSTRDGVNGSLDLVRGSVEHTRFESRPGFGPSPSGASGAVAGGERVADEHRKVTIGAAISQLTLHDRGALGTFSMRLGHSWIERDAGGETLRIGLVDFHFGANLAFGRAGDASRVGFAVTREPTRSATGSRIVSDWRAELSSGYDHKLVELDVRGGLSWLSSKAGGDGSATPTLVRYGTQLEGFYKLPLDFQVGAYLASAFEPQRTLDPWAAQRSWNSEAGLLLRWKRPTAERQTYAVCGLGMAE